MSWKYLDRRSRGLARVLARRLPGGTEENLRLARVPAKNRTNPLLNMSLKVPKRKPSRLKQSSSSCSTSKHVVLKAKCFCYCMLSFSEVRRVFGPLFFREDL
jgi:hypothetical protein